MKTCPRCLKEKERFRGEICATCDMKEYRNKKKEEKGEKGVANPVAPVAKTTEKIPATPPATPFSVAPELLEEIITTSSKGLLADIADLKPLSKKSPSTMGNLCNENRDFLMGIFRGRK